MEPESDEEPAPTPPEEAGPRIQTGRAVVVAVLGPRRLRVRLAGNQILEAEPAVLGYECPSEGDRVLVTADDDGRLYVVGVMRRARPVSAIDALLDATPAAAPAGLEGPAAAGPVRVHDKRGQLLFEYDPVADRATLHAPEGDLRLEVPSGRLELAARDGVEVQSPAKITLRSESGVELEARRDERGARAELTADGASFVGQALSGVADSAQLVARALGVDAHRIRTHAHRIERVVSVLDTKAERIVERARDSYREVERLSQTRAGTLRLVAQKAASLVGKDALIKARERMKIKGERIHLA